MWTWSSGQHEPPQSESVCGSGSLEWSYTTGTTVSVDMNIRSKHHEALEHSSVLRRKQTTGFFLFMLLMTRIWRPDRTFGSSDVWCVFSAGWMWNHWAPSGLIGSDFKCDSLSTCVLNFSGRRSVTSHSICFILPSWRSCRCKVKLRFI